MNLDFAPVFADWGMLLAGAAVTVEVTAASLLLGCVIGLFIGIGRLNPSRKILYGLCSAYLVFSAVRHYLFSYSYGFLVFHSLG